MRRWSIALAAVFVLAAGGSAFAQADPGISAEVTPVPGQVTLNRAAGTGSLALDSYASFFVPLRNDGGSTLNLVFFNATVSSDQQAVVVDSVIGLPAGSCSGVGTATIACSIGSMAKNTGKDFYVVVRAPQQGSSIVMNYLSGGDEGNGGGNGCCNLAGSATTGLRDPATDPLARERTTSFVRPGIEQSYFTGTGTAATATDPWLTFVTVPASSQQITTLEIVETSSNVPLASNLFSREVSSLTIPGTFASLRIILRRDSSTIASSAKIASARIYYYGGTDPGALGTELFACTAAGPAPGVPCIASRVEFSKKTAPTPAWERDWQFEILAIDNGRYSQ
jgi:hypothetical protein